MIVYNHWVIQWIFGHMWFFKKWQKQTIRYFTMINSTPNISIWTSKTTILSIHRKSENSCTHDDLCWYSIYQICPGNWVKLSRSNWYVSKITILNTLWLVYNANENIAEIWFGFSERQTDICHHYATIDDISTCNICFRICRLIRPPDICSETIQISFRINQQQNISVLSPMCTIGTLEGH